MRNYLLTVTTLFVMHSASAQSTFSVRGGVNFSNITNSAGGDVEDNKMLTSFHVGGVMDLPLSTMVSFQPGVFFTGKGSKARTTFGNNYVEAKFNPYYIEVPLSLKLKFPFGVENHFVVHAGPYAAIGVGGKSKITANIGGTVFESTKDIEFSNDNPFSEEVEAEYNTLNRFDFGLQAGIGLELRHFHIYVNGGWGLTKLSAAEENNDDKNKYRLIQVGIGIPLGK